MGNLVVLYAYLPAARLQIQKDLRREANVQLALKADGHVRLPTGNYANSEPSQQSANVINDDRYPTQKIVMRAAAVPYEFKFLPNFW
jgi:hypothetical protein